MTSSCFASWPANQWNSLVGLPPTAGFAGKLFLLSAAWDQGYHWLVIVAVLNTAISIYYYLGLVRHAYTGASDAPALAFSRGFLALGGVLAAPARSPEAA